MYQITLDNEFIFGTGVYARPSYDIVSPKLLLEVNTAGSFTFTVYPKHPHYNSITELTSYVEITMKGNVLFRGRVISIQRGFYNEKYVVCEGCLAYLMDTIQRSYDFMSGDNHTTPEELFRFFIDRHNGLVDKKRRFIIGDITVTDPNDYIVRADSTYLNTWDSVCQKLIEGFGGILQVRYETDGNYIDYLASSNDISSQTIEFGKNLIDIKQTENADEIATVIVPVGMEMGESRASISVLPDEETDDICKKGDKVYSKKGIEKYGYIEKSIIYDDIAFPTYLVRNAKSLLISSLNISESVELSAADLSAVNVDMESFRLGGLVKVKSKPHDIERQFVVNRLEIDLMNPKSNRLTLGSMSDSITSQLTSGASGSFSYSGGGGQLYQAGTGLELFGSTFNHKNSIAAGSVGNYADKILGWGEGFQVPSITYDSEGHIKSVRTRLLQLPPDPQRTYTSGDGIEIAGDVISLSDVITGGTAGQTTAAAPSFGEGFPVPWIKFNDKGQIIGSGNRTVVLPSLDAEMSDTSTNAAENKAVKKYVDDKYNTNRTDITALKATDKSMQTDMLNISKNVASNTATANTAKAKAEDALAKVGSGNAAGSDTPGGAATSAEKLTKSAGAPELPVYFDNGVPKVCMYTLGSMAAKSAGDYLPSSGGTVTSDKYAEQLKINRTTSLTTNVLSAIDYLINGVRKGLLGFDIDGTLHVRNADNTDVLTIDSAGTVTLKVDSELTVPHSHAGRGAALASTGVKLYSPQNKGIAWASGINFYKSDKETRFGAIGAYGSPDALKYYYVGGDWQNPAVKVMPDGKLTSAAGGKLLYSGSMSTAGGSLTIPDLADYSAVLLQTSGVGINGLNCGLTALIPISYISKGNSVQLYGGIPSTAYVTSDGPQATKGIGGYITASMTAGSPTTLTLAQSVGTIGTIQIYSII